MRKSEVTVRGYRLSPNQSLLGAEFPSGRVVLYREDDLLMFYDDGPPPGVTEVQLTEGLRPYPRTGVGYRTDDVSGVSGEGVVFDFVHFPAGWVIQEWRNEDTLGLEAETPKDSGIDFRPSMSMAIDIHGHDGGTEYVYDNGEVAQS